MNAAASGRAGDGCMDHSLQDTPIPLPQPTTVIWEVTLGRDQNRVFTDIDSLCIPSTGCSWTYTVCASPHR